MEIRDWVTLRFCGFDLHYSLYNLYPREIKAWLDEMIYFVVFCVFFFLLLEMYFIVWSICPVQLKT